MATSPAGFRFNIAVCTKCADEIRNILGYLNEDAPRKEKSGTEIAQITRIDFICFWCEEYVGVLEQAQKRVHDALATLHSVTKSKSGELTTQKVQWAKHRMRDVLEVLLREEGSIQSAEDHIRDTKRKMGTQD